MICVVCHTCGIVSSQLLVVVARKQHWIVSADPRVVVELQAAISRSGNFSDKSVPTLLLRPSLGLQVSNDQMRDHVWSMLRPKHMLKWRQRHVIDYSFSQDHTQFYPREPLPYTPCIQEVRPGVWLLPSTEQAAEAQVKWLLCQPQPSP